MLCPTFRTDYRPAYRPAGHRRCCLPLPSTTVRSFIHQLISLILRYPPTDLSTTVLCTVNTMQALRSSYE